jgi:hypothetical protein
MDSKTERCSKSIRLVNKFNNEIKKCIANKDARMDYDDECNGGLDCKNKSVKKCKWK